MSDTRTVGLEQRLLKREAVCTVDKTGREGLLKAVGNQRMPPTASDAERGAA